MKRLLRCLFLALLLASAAGMTGQRAAAQITTNTALPVTQGQGIVRLQSKVIRATGDAGPSDRELTVLAFPVVGVYGVTPRLTLFGVAPLLDKSLDVTTPQGRVERSPSGLGDARLFARYTVYRRNRQGATLRLAPYAGLELPTGASDAEDDLGPLPPPLQLGSGSWDPFAGLVFTYQTLAWQVDVVPSYQRNTEAGGFRFGDVARLDVASKYRLLPRTLEGTPPGFFYVNLETNLIRKSESEAGGAAVSGTGGTTWFVAPGLQYITRKIVVESAVQLPLAQDLGPAAPPEHDFITTLSLRVNL